MSDEDIDYLDIPELDEEFFKNAQRIEQKLKSEVNNISIRSDILEWFKTHAREKKYEDFINDVLESYIYNQKKC